MTQLIILLVVMLISIWIYISYRNYRNTLNVIYLYEKTINDFNKAEKEENDTFQKAFMFNERENIINKNLATEELRIELEKSPKKYKVKLFLSFLALGPFYNI